MISLKVQAAQVVQVILQRPYLQSKSMLSVGAYVNLLTSDSISFQKGLIIKKTISTKFDTPIP
jgi:hypothetical protein